MATPVAHAQQAMHNQRFLESINPALFPDWVVTAAFYKADEGREWYPNLLMDAVRNFDAGWLADELIKQDLIALSEPVGPDGVESPVDRAMVERFARQEVALLRARAVCVLACGDRGKAVEVYRVEEIPNASFAVQNLLHTPADAKEMLAKLRRGRSLEQALGLPEGFRSGLGLRIYQDASA